MAEPQELFQSHGGASKPMNKAKSRVNQKSLENLKHEGRPKAYEQKKATHNITVTPTGWKGIQDTVRSLGYSGVSEFIEQVGRGQVYVEKKTTGICQTNSQVDVSFEDIKTLFQNTLQEHEIKLQEHEIKLQEHEMNNRKLFQNVLDQFDHKFKDFINGIHKILLESSGLLR